MRFSITVNFVLLGVCLALSPGQEALKSRGEVQVPSSESHHPPQLATVKDPKLCAIIVKRIKDFENISKNGGLPSLTTGTAIPPPGSSSSSKPLASKVARRSKLTQRTDIGINLRDSSGTKDASASSTADPDACKEMETMLKAAREKMQADMKKGMPVLQQNGAKKDPTVDPV